MLYILKDIHALKLYVSAACVALLGRLLTALMHALMTEACSIYNARYAHADICWSNLQGSIVLIADCSRSQQSNHT